MRPVRLLLASFALLILTVCNVQSQSRAGLPRDAKISIPIETGWRFRQADQDAWYPASVPGCVHTDLMRSKLIDDPFYRDNEPKLQWIGKTDWEYQTTFNAAPDILKHKNLELVFEGLDTYADVYLNDMLVLKADNMFRTWRVDAKPALKVGSNTLRIHFRSPINEILPLMAKMSYQLPAVNDQGEKTSPFTRKAPYQYGWDWGPRFVTSGIWRPVSLEAWDTARVESLRIVQNKLDTASAQMTAEVEVISSNGGDATVIIENLTDKSAPVRQPVKLVAGTNKVAVNFRIDKPHLWWPNGMGAHSLYDLRARVFVGGRQVDEAATRTGLRTLELRQQPDKDGKTFTFVINGVPVFAKGANWIPADSFPTRMTRERYRQLIESARDSRMNLLHANMNSCQTSTPISSQS